MQGLGVLFLAFAGWVAYCALHSYRPVRMLEAIVSNPTQAKSILSSADASVSAEAALDVTSTSSGGSTAPASNVSSSGGSSLNVAPLSAAAQSLASTFPQGNPNPTEVAAYQSYANNYGSSLLGSQWSSAQMAALVELWNRESGWRPNALNSSSGANGIPQELGHSVPSGYSTNPEVQIQWGLQYIQQRYGTPEAAWAHETAYGWY